MPTPVAIEVRDVRKGFSIHQRRPSGSGPLRGLVGTDRHERRLEVLRGISFDVHRGEFFGIVGRNGSGKSTLLKLLCSIYALDSGRIRLAGRLAPFLELGVGFNPAVAARENVILNGVLMGLTPAEARHRCDEIIEFAGLSDHTDLQLKNYSSGMKVRLGFAVMTHVDADILLVDEVLAVGDAEFQGRCDETFRRMHAEGRTIVLVTHSMEAIGAYCDRGLALDDGEIGELGGPADIIGRYVEINARTAALQPGESGELSARIADAFSDNPLQIEGLRLEGCDRDGRFEPGAPIRFSATITAHEPTAEVGLVAQLASSAGAVIHLAVEAASGADARLAVGEPIRVTGAIENRLAAGHYTLNCGPTRLGPSGDQEPAGRTMIVPFEVGGETPGGIVRLDQELTWTREPTGSAGTR